MLYGIIDFLINLPPQNNVTSVNDSDSNRLENAIARFDE